MAPQSDEGIMAISWLVADHRASNRPSFCLPGSFNFIFSIFQPPFSALFVKQLVNIVEGPQLINIIHEVVYV